MVLFLVWRRRCCPGCRWLTVHAVCVCVQWPNYDNNPSITADWKDFGGWKKAEIKQYAGTSDECGAGIDKNSK